MKNMKCSLSDFASRSIYIFLHVSEFNSCFCHRRNNKNNTSINRSLKDHIRTPTYLLILNLLPFLFEHVPLYKQNSYFFFTLLIHIEEISASFSGFVLSTTIKFLIISAKPVISATRKIDYFKILF